MAAAMLRQLAARIARCQVCPRLHGYLLPFQKRPGYWGRPVPGFGDPKARLLIIGLAPGAHGANRTGRPFTGDSAGNLLYRALFAHHLSSAPTSTGRDDGLELKGVFITNLLKCAPPKNRPLGQEQQDCAPFLRQEQRLLAGVRSVLALGQLAHTAYLRLVRHQCPKIKLTCYPFHHASRHELPNPLPPLFDSFHPSRYNVNTGRLTYAMFSRVVGAAARQARQSCL